MSGKHFGSLSLFAAVTTIVVADLNINCCPNSTGPQPPLPVAPAPREAATTISADALPPNKTWVIYRAVLTPKGAVLDGVKEVAATPDDDSGPTLLLTIEDAVLPELPAVDAKVFVLDPDGAIPLSAADPGYVGTFSLGSVDRAGKPYSHNMDLSATIRELKKSPRGFQADQPIIIGVVGVGGMPKATPVEFRAVSLTVRQ